MYCFSSSCHMPKKSTLKHIESQSINPRFHPSIVTSPPVVGQPCDFSHPDNTALLCFRSQVHKAFPLSRSSCALASKSRHSREETLDPGGPHFLETGLGAPGVGPGGPLGTGDAIGIAVMLCKGSCSGHHLDCPSSFSAATRTTAVACWKKPGILVSSSSTRS